MEPAAEYRQRKRQEAIQKGKRQDRMFILCTVAAVVFFLVAFIT